MGRTFVIAEAGVNHNGNLDTARRLVDMAVQCGADAIKFQTFKAYETTGIFAKKAKYQLENEPKKESQLEMIQKLELPFEAFKEIQHYCIQKNIMFISTPDGEESLNYLINLDVPMLKVGSTEITNPEFLIQIGSSGKPIILSTGMATLGEVEAALNVIYSTGNFNIQLMHCTTDYPTKLEDVNLKAMETMAHAFKIPVGLSDHTGGVEAAIAAVALGAVVIEKHITLDKDMAGPDHKASMELSEFVKYVQCIRNAELLLGNGIKKPTESEKAIMKDARRSIVARKDLKKGQVLNKELFSFKRPGDGIKPELIYILEGKSLKRDLLKDEPVQWTDI